ncbi:efflux RND transporter periplasmic adaptor subunit [Thiobacillus sp.]
MTLSLARVLYYSVLLVVPVSMAGVVYFSERLPDANADSIVQSAQAADRLERLDGASAAKKMWVCPMHPQILQDHPGECPICGMDLVETGAAHDHHSDSMQIDTALQQRLGMRLARVEPRRLTREIHAYGTVGVDEDSVHAINPKIEGWLSKLHVSTVGQRVVAGQLLYEIYSPDLVQRQREYIELLQRRDRLLDGSGGLYGQTAEVAASLARERIRVREKLAYADISVKTIAQIERTYRAVDQVPVYAPQAGYITQIGAREGAYVTPATPLLSLADNATVWIDIALYPDQLEWVQEGDSVKVTFPHSDRPPLHGRLKLALPTIDPATRTARARLVVKNADRLLRPGAYVDVAIATRPRTELAVPRSAVIRTGRGDRVMLVREGGHFMPVPVLTGIESGDFIEIIDGVQEGAQVAVSGQFLLDAAASLSDSVQRMQTSH